MSHDIIDDQNRSWPIILDDLNSRAADFFTKHLFHKQIGPPDQGGAVEGRYAAERGEIFQAGVIPGSTFATGFVELLQAFPWLPDMDPIPQQPFRVRESQAPPLLDRSGKQHGLSLPSRRHDRVTG